MAFKAKGRVPHVHLLVLPGLLIGVRVKDLEASIEESYHYSNLSIIDQAGKHILTPDDAVIVLVPLLLNLGKALRLAQVAYIDWLQVLLLVGVDIDLHHLELTDQDGYVVVQHGIETYLEVSHHEGAVEALFQLACL